MSAVSHVEAARARKLADALACGIDDGLISQLVERFYDSVRHDAPLGPIFAKHVQDWPAHLARMKNFWVSIMIESGRFSGNPMQKHIAVGGLGAEHFEHWQSLWNRTVSELAPNDEVCDRFRQAAGRIGNSLLLGIELDRGGLAAVSTRRAS
ncbi:Preprotein translocase subunit TatC [Sphingomonas antarctica]|uniref:group III truncated hemoglobin n=1 Tax=Sphingomonas antarctica TaxID=2040274 RepID=UPI0039EB3D13